MLKFADKLFREPGEVADVPATDFCREIQLLAIIQAVTLRPSPPT